MSVASRNPFDLLSDETPAPAPTTTPAKEQSKTTDSPSSRGGQKGRSGPASKGGRYYQRGGAANVAPRDQPETDDAPREGKRNAEERGRGRGRGGRGRGDRGRAGGHGRPFDKHSMTGKTDTDKQISHGWGSDEGKTELKAEEDGSKDAAAETPSNDWGDGGAAAASDAWGAPAAAAAAADAAEPSGEAAQDAASAESRRNRDEEEDNTLTLDQYLAQQKEKTLALVPQLNVRKANDGDGDLFKDAVQVLRSDDDAYFAGRVSTGKTAKQRPRQLKTVIKIDGQYDRQTRGGRGGRGGDRGREGRGRGRGGRGRGRGDFHASSNGNTQQVDVNDQSAFPTLS